MYIIDTYLDKDRLPVLEKKELCRETQTLNSPDMTFAVFPSQRPDGRIYIPSGI